MAYSDQQLVEAVQPQLQPGEQVRCAAYGESTMPFWGVIACMALTALTVGVGLVVFIAWYWIALTNYVVALTDRRLIVMQVSDLTPKKVWSYPLPLQGRATTKQVGVDYNRAQRLDVTAQPPFSMRFPRTSGPNNMMNAANIAHGLQQAPQVSGGGAAGWHGPPQGPPGGGWGPR